MNNTVEQVALMVDMLPESEQMFAFEFVKRLVLAWDPDFTKLTPAEAADLAQAEAEFARGEYYTPGEVAEFRRRDTVE
jgi:hypothetical protein